MQVPHYKIAPRNLSSRQFTGKNPARWAAARTGRIFTGKLSTKRWLFCREGGDPAA